MGNFFLALLNLSISAGWIVLAILFLRLVLKKAPRWMVCALWALVAVRLVLPFSIESVVSLMPSRETLPPDIVYARAPAIQSGVAIVDRVVNDTVMTSLAPSTELTSVNPIQIWLAVGGNLWLLGMIGMLVYAVISYWRIHGNVAPSISLGNGVYLCDYIESPFILGIFRPRIYLPSNVGSQDAEYVLAHERAHLKRRDHWWKPLGYLLLSIHWFNPLLWAAYILLCRDIELACDERVLKELGIAVKKSYSAALLSCSVPRRMIAACPLAFGEVGVKARVKSVLNYRKPAFWVVLVAAVLSLTAAVCLLTDPKEKVPESPFGKYYQAQEAVYAPYGISYEDMLTQALLLSDGQNLLGTEQDGAIAYCQFSESTLEEIGLIHFLPDSKLANDLMEKNHKVWQSSKVTSIVPIPGRSCYFLLQQKDGSLYLMKGIARYPDGHADRYFTEWIYTLAPIENRDPYADGDSPYEWSRNIRKEYILDASVTAWDDEDVPEGFMLEPRLIQELLRYLNSLPEDAFVLGSGIGDLESTVHLSIQDEKGWDSRLDVVLRYGEGKVDMLFHSEHPNSYTDTGNKMWEIHDENIVNFLARYSLKNYENHPFADLSDPWQFCRNISKKYIQSTQLCRAVDGPQITGYTLANTQEAELLAVLNGLPEDAFTPVETVLTYDMEMGLPYYISMYCYNGELMQDVLFYLEDGSPWLLLWSTLYAETVKWKIDSDTLAQLLKAYENTQTDTEYGVWPGDPIWIYENCANITILQPDGWTFELVPYSDDSTPFGIRFRPLEVDEGWLFLGFWPQGFVYDKEYTIPWHPVSDTSGQTWAEHTSDGSFAFCAFANAPGDYVLISQGADNWFPEYRREVSSLLVWCNFGIGFPSKQQAIEAAGFTEEEVTYAGFDWTTGCWTIWGENAGRVIDRNREIVGELLPKESMDAPSAVRHSVVAQPKVVYYETLEALEAASDYILRVARLEDAEPQFTRNSSAVTAVQTLSQVEVLEIFKDPHGSLNPGDPLTVLEYAAWDEELTTMYHVGDYILMEEGAGYLLFLMETGNPWLAPVGIYEGVISLDDDGRDTPVETIEGITIPSWNAYTEVWQSARSKYAP